MTVEKLSRQPSDPSELRDLLQGHGLPVDIWGEGPTKKVEDLWNEIAEGESWLAAPETVEQRDEYGEIVRVTNVLGIDVFATYNGQRYRLREDRQEFKDGRGARRCTLITSLAEKIKADENHAEAVLRAVGEELGVAEEDLAVEDRGAKDVWKVTQTYPSLPSKLQISFYQVELPAEAFNPAGYVEDQPDKKTYFEWEMVTDA